MRDYDKFPCDTLVSVEAHARALSKLFQHLRNASYKIADAGPTGRWLSPARRLGLIYWPHLLGYERGWRNFSEALYTPAEMQRDLYQQGFTWRLGTPLEGAALAWWLSHLRSRTEALLGPLRLPSNTPEAFAATQVYREMCQAIDDDDPALQNVDHYTVFRRIAHGSDIHFLRVAVRPALDPSEFLVNCAAVPAPLIALFYAWQTLCERHTLGFDSNDVGLDFATDGCLLVNWGRFAASRYWPREFRQLAPLRRNERPSTPYQQLRDQSAFLEASPALFTGAVPAPADVDRCLQLLPRYCGLRPALVELDATKEHRHFGEMRPSRSVERALETGLLEYDEHGQLSATCTMIDPYALALRPTLFSGSWHEALCTKHKKSVQRLAERREEERDLGRRVAPTRVVVRVLRFRPADYLDDFIEKELREELRRQRNLNEPPTIPSPWWFESRHTEDVYAIRTRGSLAFMRPISLNLGPPSEFAVYQRALDEVNLYEVSPALAELDETGQRNLIRQVTRSQLFKQAHDEHLIGLANEAIRDAIEAKGRMTTYRVRQLNRKAADKYNRETGLPGRFWYHHGVLQQVQKKLADPDEYRRVVHVIIPANTDLAPTEPVIEERHFFTEQALDLFERFALSSMAVLRDVNVDGIAPRSDALLEAEFNTAGDTRPLQQVWHQNFDGMAPYLLAWARFCRQVLQHPERFETAAAGEIGHWPDKPETPVPLFDDVDGWTPMQDLQFLTGYRKYPRLTFIERRQLESRTQHGSEAWPVRMQVLRRQLPPLFPSDDPLLQRFSQRYKTSPLPLAEVPARRLIITYGLARALRLHRQPGFNPAIPPVPMRVARHADAVDIQQLVLPLDYRHSSWRRFVRTLEALHTKRFTT
jgi:hypothetical protein